MPSRFDDLKRLEKMLADELITREEFSKLKDELLSEASESAETSEVGRPPSPKPDSDADMESLTTESLTTWNRREEKQFISGLETRMSPNEVRQLGRHLNRVQLKGIARMNRDPYVLIYSLGHSAVDLQRLIDDAEPDEKHAMAEILAPTFASEFRDMMKRPPDDDTPIKWYADVAMAIWAAANKVENG